MHTQLTQPACWPEFAFTVDCTAREKGVAGRCGTLQLPHAVLQTPVFMPVGTQATVKAMTPEELEEIGFRLILGNTYHLHLRPGEQRIAEQGGLHRFSGWNGALLTDSGGFQVFSLKTLRKIEEDGVRFQSHIDGSQRYFNSESVMEIEHKLGADIIMAWDECAPLPCTDEYARQAMERTHRWLLRCISAWKSAGCRAEGGWPQALFGIVQGGTVQSLREESAQFLAGQNLPGYAVGGLAVGENPEQRRQAIEWSVRHLPAEKPRYLMGVGLPVDILDAVERGIDMFDCVLPTRNARNAQVFTSRGTLNLRNARFQQDASPLDSACSCRVCRRHTRAYVHHLFRANEILGLRLTTYHNLAFYHNLMSEVRLALKEERFAAFKSSFLAEYLIEDEAPETGETRDAAP